jgi:mannose-6-phosphate isomerase-like protein (cupin superfamily)
MVIQGTKPGSRSSKAFRSKQETDPADTALHDCRRRGSPQDAVSTMKLPCLNFLVAMFAAMNSVVCMASEPSPSAPKSPLASGVFEWSKLEVKATRVGARRDVFDAPTQTLGNLECHVTTVNPGEAPHAPHRHADEELLFVKEGTLDVMINGVTRQAGPGSIIFLASNDLHGLRNGGSVPATYYVLRVFPRDLAPDTAK